MGYSSHSFPSEIGSIDFYPVGMTWSNKEAAEEFSVAKSFIPDGQNMDDSERYELNLRLSQMFIDKAVSEMKRLKKSVYVGVNGDRVFVIYDESIGNVELFAPGIIPFIVRGNTAMFCCDSSFESLAMFLRKQSLSKK